MIRRFAFFDGSVHEGQEDAFRAAVMTELVPTWRRFPGALAVDVAFADSRDEGAPEFPLILSITYPDMATLAQALADPIRAASRAETEAVLARFFTGRIHHHVCQAQHFAAARQD